MATRTYTSFDLAAAKWRRAVNRAQAELGLSCEWIVCKLAQRFFESARAQSKVSRQNRRIVAGVQKITPKLGTPYVRNVWELERWTKAGEMKPRIYMQKEQAEKKKKIKQRGVGRKSWGWLIQQLPNVSVSQDDIPGGAESSKNYTAKVALTSTNKSAELFAQSAFGYLLKYAPNMMRESEQRAMNRMRHVDLAGIGRAFLKTLAAEL